MGMFGRVAVVESRRQRRRGFNRMGTGEWREKQHKLNIDCREMREVSAVCRAAATRRGTSNGKGAPLPLYLRNGVEWEDLVITDGCFRPARGQRKAATSRWRRHQSSSLPLDCKVRR